jgi:hypothetical protein
MTVNARPTHVQIVAVLALLWNLAGLWSFWYHLTATPETIAGWAPEQQAAFAAMPRWVFVPFAVGTVGGVLGSLGLLLGRRWAEPVFLLSLLGIVVNFSGYYLTTPAWRLSGPQGALFPLVIALAGLSLWVYARRGAARGWLR